MNKMLGTAILLCTFYVNLKSQVFLPQSTGQNLVFLNVGLEPDLIAIIGYLHLMNNAKDKNHFYLGSNIKFAPFILKNNAWRFNIAQGFSYPLASQWNGYLSNDFFLAHNKNRAGIMNGLGFDLKAAIITQGKKWNKGIEAGWQCTAFTHIKNYSAAKDAFNERYPNDTVGITSPVDGWYGVTANRFRVGFIIEKHFSSEINFQINFGTSFIKQKQRIVMAFPYAQIPAYFNSQLSYAW